MLAQGFKNSPTLFGQALARDLEEWDNEEALLLQYVDDLLIATVGQTPCLKATVSLLNFIGLRGYRVAWSKAQIALPEVRYLGFHIWQGEHQLSNKGRKLYAKFLPQEIVSGSGHFWVWQAFAGYGSQSLDYGLNPCTTV
ncbi:unnamed protein product [Eretmochelys imbricata]